MADRIPIRRDGPPKGMTYKPPAAKPSLDRQERHRFYCSARWQRCRAEALRRQPLCETCLAEGVIEPGKDVHHRVDLADGGAPLDLENLAMLCRQHHSAVTRRRQHQKGEHGQA